MAIDFTKPATTDNYSTQFVPNIQANQIALAQWLDSSATTITAGTVAEMKRYNATSGLFERWTGSAWATLGVGYVAKAGDTMSGNLTITKTTPIFQLNDTGSANSSQIVFSQTAVGKAYIGVPSTAGGLVASSVVGDLVLRSESGTIRFSRDAGASSALVISSGGVQSNVVLYSQVSGGQAVLFNRLGSGGLIGEFLTSVATGGYVRFGYNSAANIHGFIGGADTLITGASIANFAIRAEAALLFSVAGANNIGYAALLSGGFAVGGSATVVSSFATTNRAVLGIEGNGSTGSSLLGFGNTSVYKSYLYDDGAAASTFRVNAATVGGRIVLGTNGTDQWFFTAAGDFLLGASTSAFTTAGRGVIGINGSSTALLGFHVGGTAVGNIYHGGTNLGLTNQTATGTLDFATNSSVRFSISAAGVATTFDTGSGAQLEVGFRSLIISTPSNGSALIVGQRGAMVVGAFSSLVVNTGVFARGDMVTFYQDSASSMTLTQGSGFTLRLGGSATTGSRTILQRGTATLLFNSGTEAVLVGNCS